MESGIGYLQDLDMLLLSSLILRICCNQSKVADCWAASAAAVGSKCNRDRGVLGMCIASCIQGIMCSEVVTERQGERHVHKAMGNSWI
jgi:glycine betaine/choline ABC-type transport system substrate-binding protein